MYPASLQNDIGSGWRSTDSTEQNKGSVLSRVTIWGGGGGGGGQKLPQFLYHICMCSAQKANID